MDVLEKLFEQHFHAPVERVQPLQGQLGGSGRRIIRLSRGKASAIGILYDVREENEAFLEFSRHFRRHGLPVPEIYAEDLDHGAYVEEDLGDVSLFQFLSEHRKGEEIAPPAILAVAAIAAIPAHAHSLTNRPSRGNVCSHSVDHTDHFMAGNAGILNAWELSLLGHFITVANATGLNPYAHQT